MAIVGNMSQAPTNSPARLILDAFLDPEMVVPESTGPDIAGSYDCSATAGGEEVGTGVANIAGSPAGYWGRMSWNNESIDRIIYSSSDPDLTWLISVDQGGRLTSLRITGSEDGNLTGDWTSGGRGEFACQRR